MQLISLVVASSYGPSLSMISLGVMWQDGKGNHAGRVILEDPMTIPKGQLTCTSCGHTITETQAAPLHEQVAWALREVVPVCVFSEWGTKYLFVRAYAHGWEERPHE